MSTGTVSVVVCTHGERQEPLERLVSALGWQTLPFELVIVAGAPSPGLRSLLSRLSSQARIAEIGELNISRARNAGIRAAASDVIVFIDDDAVPVDEEWLDRLTVSLRDTKRHARLAAVGSMVIRGDSQIVEFAGGATSLSGHQRFDATGPLLAPDGTPWIARVPGGNCAIARDALEAVRGFDEQFAYYLDETDLCVRLTAAGYRIAYTPLAPIRHYAAPSVHGRPGQRHRFPVARSDAYFAVRHMPGPVWRRACAAVLGHRSKHFVREGRSLLQRGELSAAGLVRFRADCWRGLASGTWAGLTQVPSLGERLDSRPGSHLPFTARQVLILDPGHDTLGGDDVPAKIGAWAADIQRRVNQATVAIGSARVKPADAPSVWRILSPLPCAPGRVEAEWFSEPSIRSEASPWITTLTQERLAHATLVWLGSASAGSLLAACLGRRVALASIPETELKGEPAAAEWIVRSFDLVEDSSRPRASTADAVAELLDRRAAASFHVEASGQSPCLVEVARLFERSLRDGAGDAASMLSDPLAVEAALAVVRHCLKDGYPDLALTVGQRIAARLAPDDPRSIEAAYHVANALRKLGREVESIGVYESIRERGPRASTHLPLVGGACFHLGVAARASGRDEEAARLFEECLEHAPAHAAARQALAELQATH